MTKKLEKPENVLEIDPEIEATLQPHQCPQCGYVNSLNADYSPEIRRNAESGVMNGKPYQIVEVITTVCQQCGTCYTIKNYYHK
jgi:hypothetical protein